MRTKLEYNRTTAKYILVTFPFNGPDVSFGQGFTKGELYDLYTQLRQLFDSGVCSTCNECKSITPCSECKDYDSCTKLDKEPR